MGPRQIGGGVLAVIAVVAPMIAQAANIGIPEPYGYWALAACAVAALVGIGLAFWPERKEAAAVAGDSYTNSGNNFGHMGPVNIGKPLFELTNDHIRQVLELVPKGKDVDLFVVGPQRASLLGDQIDAALRSAGFHVTIYKVGVISPPPDGPLTVNPRGPTTTVTIAPSA